ncbi:MAG: flagellin lysine-N-methylase, partial [Clostridium sp.]|nr:flagellin lysine-N-methylase [Clostridium sp.]
MTIEYPDYYEKFRCIGGACPDTCCAGWEVDIDEETAEYYLQQEGEFGERLRSHMRQEAEDDGEAADGNDGWYFPLTCEGRCPFLNRENLCDIYTALGEESLCQVCTEYPRYFAGAGDYQQVDMSLSCMELGRIFFGEKDRIHYYLSENDADGEDISQEDQERLDDIIGQRCDWTDLLQQGEGTLEEKLGQIFAEAEADRLLEEPDEAMLSVMEAQEVLDHRWEAVLCEIRTGLRDLQSWRPERDLPEEQAADYERYFTKLAVYFL